MNITRTVLGRVLVATLLAAALRARGDLTAPTKLNVSSAKPEHTFTGTVVSVNPSERTLSVRGWAFYSKKSFNVSDNCTYAFLFTTVANNHGTVNDLRPGEKVTVSYQDAHGVLIADQIEQQPLQFEGTVLSIDPGKHALTLHRRGLDKDLTIAEGCVVMLRQNKAGTLADLHPGDNVTALYETPDGNPTVREITQTSQTFVGTLTAIDLDEKTVKAKSGFGTMKFNIADDCTFVSDGKADGKLSNFRPTEVLVFNYNAINGVNVVNRVGPAPDTTPTHTNITASSPGVTGSPSAQ